MLGATGRDWTDADRLLAVALTEHESRLCPCGCGFPRDVAWDPDADGWFEGRAHVCYAKAAAERWRQDHAKDADLGTLLAVVDAREPSGAADEPDAGDDQPNGPEQ